MDALESAFSSFRSALRDPVAGDPEAIARSLHAGLDAAATVMRPRSASATTSGSAPGVGPILAVGALVLGAAAGILRARARSRATSATAAAAGQTSGRAITK